MSNPVIQTHELTRYFGRKCALDQVSFNVPRGSVFALLGRNGSGKSTLIRILMGLLDPTRGSATVLGDDCRRLYTTTRGRIAYVSEGHPLIDWMRVRDLESFQRSFYPNWNARIFKTVLEQFSLDPELRAGQLSRGQAAGVSLALALAQNPELLVMDDPAMGLDPVAQRALLEAMILVTRNSGNTVVFSAQRLDDVERVADHVAILDSSVLRVSCRVETLLSLTKRLVLSFDDPPRALPKVPGLLEARRDEHAWALTLTNFDDRAREIVRSLGANSIHESDLSLQDAVIAYLGQRGERATLLQQARTSPQEVGAS